MSVARQHRLLKATKPEPFVTPMERLGNALDRMVAIQMTSYPASWSEEDKREMAELHLFGRNNSNGEIE